MRPEATHGTGPGNTPAPARCRWVWPWRTGHVRCDEDAIPEDIYCADHLIEALSHERTK